jgi:GyrI-like small molecule binding domain
MQYEILAEPLQFTLHGKSSAVEVGRYGEVGLKLMNEMWRIVKEAKMPNMGLNHWVYLPGGRMFVGVELEPGAPVPKELEPLSFGLPRYLKHVHIGPYQALPEKWKSLNAEIAARGETIADPSLEIYGHHCDDPAKTETTILIGITVP